MKRLQVTDMVKIFLLFPLYSTLNTLAEQGAQNIQHVKTCKWLSVCRERFGSRVVWRALQSQMGFLKQPLKGLAAQSGQQMPGRESLEILFSYKSAPSYNV